MLFVLIRSGTGNKYIIDVNETEVHEPLESLTRIPQTEGHADKFKQTKWCGNCCFGDISRFNGDLVIGADKVQLREDTAAM